MNDTLINAYQNELAFMKQEKNKWKERTKKAVKERNNLQSKIDKANEILDKLEMQPAYLDCKYYELEGFKELKDILKEDK